MNHGGADVTKDEFIAKFGDELTGLLLASFAQAEKSGPVDMAENGRFMLNQMRKARGLLVRMHEAIQPPPPVPVKPEPQKGSK